MAQNPFEILGISENCDDNALYTAYRAKRNEYADKRFLSGDEGRHAAEMLDKIEEAYKHAQEILDAKKQAQQRASAGDFGSGANSGYGAGSGSGYGSTMGTRQNQSGFPDIDSKLRGGDFAGAEQLLVAVAPASRTAEWHYMYSIVFYKKGWYSEAIAALTNANQMDPGNQKYSDALKNLLQQQSTHADPNANRQYANNRSYRNTYADGSPAPQSSGCDICTGLCCADCLCRSGCCRC